MRLFQFHMQHDYDSFPGFPWLVAIYKASGYTLNRLRIRSNTKDLSHWRLIAFHTLRTQTNMSYPELGAVFTRDHTTVLYGCNAVLTRLREMDARTRADVQRVQEMHRSLTETDEMLYLDADLRVLSGSKRQDMPAGYVLQELALPKPLHERVRKLAKDGLLGTTVSEVIIHLLRQQLAEK